MRPCLQKQTQNTNSKWFYLLPFVALSPQRSKVFWLQVKWLEEKYLLYMVKPRVSHPVAEQKGDCCRESFAVISPENRQWPNMPLPTAPEGWILPQKLSARRNNAMNCVYKQCVCVYSPYVSVQLSLVFGSLYKLSLVIIQFKEIARSSLKALTWAFW